MKEMKNDSLNIKFRINRIVIFIPLMAIILNTNHAIGQGTKDSAAGLPFTMNLNSTVSNGVRSVKVLVTRKESKRTIIVDDIKSPFNLYLNEVKDYDAASGTGWMSKTYLNSDGEVIFKFPTWFTKLADTVHEYTFIVKTAADPKYEDAEEEITVADARIDLEYFGEDSIKTASASISGWNKTEYVAVPNAELKLGIKRTFNYLPFVEAGSTTNEEGKISGELPLDLPGNANKTITLVARLEDDAVYGNVEITRDVPWAILPKPNPVRGRTLWSPGGNAPLILVISSITIILIIWGTIFYLLSLLFKIKRLGKLNK